MQAPMILPWIAHQASISEDLALKLWRRAAGEAEIRLGNHASPEYHRRVMSHFLALVEEESIAAGHTPSRGSSTLPLAEFVHSQRRIARQSFLAAENLCRYWQNQCQNYCLPREAAWRRTASTPSSPSRCANTGATDSALARSARGPLNTSYRYVPSYRKGSTLAG